MRLHHIGTAVLLASLGAPTLLAQTAPKGRIEGQITDSVHARPAAGATVYVARLSPDPTLRVATTDEKGRFAVDSLIAGRYTVDFTTPFLDSLDLTLPSREVTLAADERQRLELGIPSGATLRAAACPGVELPKGKGAVVGRVVNADTDQPLIGATVAVSWVDIGVDRATLHPTTEQRGGAMPVDSVGNYRLCGVPTDTYLLVQVQHKGRAGSTLRLSVTDDVGVTKRDLSLSESASRGIALLDSSAAAAENTPTPRLSGTATLTGTVRGAGGRPLPDARVSVVDATGSSQTDSAGHFTLSNLPAGTQLIEVRRIGYLLGQLPVELRSGRSVNQDITLSTIVSLDSVRITAQRSRYRDYETRARRSGAGRFISEDDIQKRNPNEVSDILRMMPGFRIVGAGLDAQVVSSRGRISLRQGECAANVVIDGMQHQEINLVRPSDIGALEVYNGIGAPMQYDSVCGVIVIWTKR
ncbi:MAG: carboxypeptidase regulatory-like domain-containing protein [Gemmatimonadaceae bacterium]